MAPPTDDGLQDPALSSSDERPASAPKRKRTDDDDTAAPPLSKRAAKLKKKRAAGGGEKAKSAYDDAIDVDAGVNLALTLMDPQLLADHIAQRNRRANKDLSEMELDELRLSASSIIDSTPWRKERSLTALPSFLEHFSTARKADRRKLDEAPPAPGSPHTLVIAGAGLRAADLTRALRRYQTSTAKVEKLFAKHIKLEETAGSLRRNRVSIGVGTPQRIMDLLDDGALKSDEVRMVVVDASHVDSKKRGVLDMQDTLGPLLRLLCREEFKGRYAEQGGVRLVFF